MRDEPGALPLMQFALKDLFDTQHAKGDAIALTLNDYLARGGLRKALERHADTAFAQLSESEQQLAWVIFSGLIEIGRGTQDTRRTASFDDLVPANADTAQVRGVVQKLADARLIITDERDHKETVTLAHETLIEAWPWLRRLINENREAIAAQNQMAEDAFAWDDHHRDASYLYTGVRLGLAQARIKAQSLGVTEQVQTFVQAGIHAQRREQLRRIGTPMVVLVFAFVLLGVGFLGYSLVLRAQARGETVVVLAGEFVLGPAESTDVLQDRQVTGRARVSEFRIEKYEVTNTQYRLCVQDRACSEPANLALYKGAEKEKMPVVAITLKQAADYCQWIGRRVPTEVEWEWAAKGAETWKYPNGNEEPDPRRFNLDDFATDRDDHRVAVDQLPVEKRGTYGLTGNVLEWTTSIWLDYDNPLYQSAFWPQSLEPNQLVVARGGSWAGIISQARSTSRYPLDPKVPANYVGVRCVEGEGSALLKGGNTG
jgi:formylglycine-generating enzyme required for sulfatase activity